MHGKELAKALFAVGALAVAISVSAADSLKVSDARVLATVPGQTVAAGYMTLESATAARVVSVESDAAASVQIHAMSMHGDVMRMRRLESLELPPGRTIRLTPGGIHLMLMGLQSPLHAGDTVALRLIVASPDGASRVERLNLPVVSGHHGSGGRHD